jgi:hypothetical protein
MHLKVTRQRAMDGETKATPPIAAHFRRTALLATPAKATPCQTFTTKNRPPTSGSVHQRSLAVRARSATENALRLVALSARSRSR